MRRETRQEREAWTATVEGRSPKSGPRFGNNDRRKTGGYQSDHEAAVAVNLVALEKCGEITDLKEQVNVELVPGRDGIRPIVWRADFVYKDRDGRTHFLDAKGHSTQLYILKKKLAFLLLGITVEEIRPKRRKSTCVC